MKINETKRKRKNRNIKKEKNRNIRKEIIIIRRNYDERTLEH